MSGRAFPCTLLQARLWSLSRKGGPKGLNVAMRWRVDGPLPHATAEAALQTLIQRHEILRTAFREIDGELSQVVLSQVPARLREVDLSFLPADGQAARAKEIAKAEALEPIDPGQAPLMRATLLRCGPERSILLLTFHAMAVDGWSTGLLANEFRAIAQAIDAGTTPDLSEPELQFADYALWEKELLASDALDEARTYWQRRLHNATGTEVPTDHRPPGRRSRASHIRSILLPDDLSRAIEGFGRQKSVTLYSLAAAALALMLYRVTRDPEIVIGSQVANREDPAAENLVGPTVNSVTLCLPIDETAGLHAFASSVADVVQDALKHQRLPFEIAEGFARHRNGMPLHAINLVVHRSYSGTAETERETAGSFNLVSLPSYSSGTEWPLNFYMISRDEGWRLSCEADADLYDAETVQGLLEAWRLCFAALATSPDSRLSDCVALQAVSPRPGGSGTPIPLHNPARQVVRFHEGGSKTPVIMLNNISVYYPLARELGEDRPFIDIQLYHPTGPIELPPHDFETFAAYAVRLIRWAQPKGPYVLGGHCVYGVLAFEAARQLRSMGEEVLLVAVFDSWAPGYRETMSARDKKLRQRQLRMYGYGKRIGQYQRSEIGLDEIVRKPILRRLGLLAPEEPVQGTRPGEWFDDYLRAAAARYRPPPYDASVILFRSEEPLRGRLFDDCMGWAPLVSGPFDKVDVSSNHQNMFRDQYAEQIATVMRSALAKKEDA
jgi:thioesterase domain-containing protein